MSPETIETIFSLLSRAYPNPRTELRYRNPFQLLIAVILSAQSTDAAVNKITPDLFRKAPTPEAMIELGVDGIRRIIQRLGLANMKAKHIHHCSRRLVSDFKSEVPASRKDLESLPGVGRKTAGVILNMVFHQPTIPVDTHVFRVSNRIGLVKAVNVLETEKQLLMIVPDTYRLKAHHFLILHGRHICKAKRPSCGQCLLVKYCTYPRKNAA